ncbi:MAG: D-2-hydroxyacid dehydrogenase [Clostridia bacterium]|nr:D-2-hydroxyacid dehydrogenase [Clostridia bacterium]
MNIAVLDKNTLTVGDLDFSVIESLGSVKYCKINCEEDIIAACADCEAILCNKIVISRRVISSLPRLKYVGLFATGYNNVDIAAAREAGVIVANVPGYSTYAVAQHTFAMILHFCSQVFRYDESVKSGDWVRSETFSYFPYPMQELQGKVLGVYGLGNIGRRVAKIGEAMGMRVIVRSRTISKDAPYEFVGDEIFGMCDFLTLHCPLTPDTAGIINADTLRRMKRSAVLINTARGGLVDEYALAEALNNGIIAGAALDTLSCEPPKADNPLLNARNCVITPHVAWAPTQTRRRLLECVAHNLSEFAKGRPVNVVSL